MRKFAIGLVSGTVSSCVNIPFDVAKSRIQGPQPVPGEIKYRSCFQSMALVYREEGYLALYKGLIPKIMRLGPGGAVMLLVYEYVSGWLQKNWWSSAHHHQSVLHPFQVDQTQCNDCSSTINTTNHIQNHSSSDMCHVDFPPQMLCKSITGSRHSKSHLYKTEHNYWDIWELPIHMPADVIATTAALHTLTENTKRKQHLIFNLNSEFLTWLDLVVNPSYCMQFSMLKLFKALKVSLLNSHVNSVSNSKHPLICLTLENVVSKIILPNLDISTNWIIGIQIDFRLIFDI